MKIGRQWGPDVSRRPSFLTVSQRNLHYHLFNHIDIPTQSHGQMVHTSLPMMALFTRKVSGKVLVLSQASRLVYIRHSRAGT